MSFPRFAGGKFISNCLSLSKYCCPQDPVAATHLLTTADDYNYRFKSVMSTLPPTRESMNQWISNYEFGDRQLYGIAINNWQRGIEYPVPKLISQLIDSNFRLFLTAHSGEYSVRNLLKVWPNSSIVKLINHKKFSEISYRLKTTDNKTPEELAGNYCESKYNLLAGPDWPTWKEFDAVGYDISKLPQYQNVSKEIINFYNWQGIDNIFLFDVDNSMFNRARFLEAIEELYKNLGFLDFNSNLVEKFWQSYMTLHIDNVD